MTIRKHGPVLTAYIVFFLAAVAAWYRWLDPMLNPPGAHGLPPEIVWVLGKTVIWIAPVLAYIKFIDRVSPPAALKLGRAQLPGALWGLLAGLGWLALMLAKELFQGQVAFDPGMGLHYWLGGLLVGFWEEIPFRGLILSKLAARIRFWPANILTATLFLLYHFPKWLVQGNPHFILNSITVVGISLVCGYLYKKTNSLWAPAVFHSLVDLVLFMGIGI